MLIFSLFFVINVGFAQAHFSTHAILQDKTLILITNYTLRLYKLVIASKSRPENNTVYLQLFLNETFAKSCVFKPIANDNVSSLGLCFFIFTVLASTNLLVSKSVAGKIFPPHLMKV